MNIGDRVQWTHCSIRGRSMSMTLREGTVVNLSKPTGKNALVKMRNGHKKWMACSQLQRYGEKSELTSFVEAMREESQ